MRSRGEEFSRKTPVERSGRNSLFLTAVCFLGLRHERARQGCRAGEFLWEHEVL